MNKLNTFRYNVIGFEEYDGEKIINHIEEKLKNKKKITSKDSIYLSLAPLMDKKKNNNISEKIKRVVDILIELNQINPTGNRLSFGIEWLLVDKFVKNPELRNLLIDVLGEKMSAIYEYGERKEQKGKEEGIKEGKEESILKLYKSGMKPEEISQRLDTDLDKIKKIINK